MNNIEFNEEYMVAEMRKVFMKIGYVFFRKLDRYLESHSGSKSKKYQRRVFQNYMCLVVSPESVYEYYKDVIEYRANLDKTLIYSLFEKYPLFKKHCDQVSATYEGYELELNHLLHNHLKNGLDNADKFVQEVITGSGVK